MVKFRQQNSINTIYGVNSVCAILEFYFLEFIMKEINFDEFLERLEGAVKNGVKDEADILNAVIISKALAQLLHDSAEIKGVNANEIDIFQKFYYAVNDGRFDGAINKVIDAYKK